MTTSIIIGAIVIAALAVAALALALRGRDTSTAIGQLSGETVKRDKKLDVPEPGDTTASGAGKQVELAGSARGRAALVAAESAPPVAYVPPDPETVGVARRQFLNRGILGMFALGLGGFGAACIGFLWPQGVAGFGSKVTVGRIPDIQAELPPVADSSTSLRVACGSPSIQRPLLRRPARNTASTDRLSRGLLPAL